MKKQKKPKAVRIPAWAASLAQAMADDVRDLTAEIAVLKARVDAMLGPIKPPSMAGAIFPGLARDLLRSQGGQFVQSDQRMFSRMLANLGTSQERDNPHLDQAKVNPAPEPGPMAGVTAEKAHVSVPGLLKPATMTETGNTTCRPVTATEFGIVMERIARNRSNYADLVTRHHVPVPADVAKIERVRSATRRFIGAILAETVPGSDRSAAVRCAREAMMWTNASIVVPRVQIPE